MIYDATKPFSVTLSFDAIRSPSKPSLMNSLLIFA